MIFAHVQVRVSQQYRLKLNMLTLLNLKGYLYKAESQQKVRQEPSKRKVCMLLQQHSADQNCIRSVVVTSHPHLQSLYNGINELLCFQML